MTNRDFWAGKRVFLTGHTGFKGSWLSLWLKLNGADVCGFALAPPTQPSLFEQAQLDTHMSWHEGDIREYETLRHAMAAFRPDIVLHLAAQALVRESYERPVETFSVNVLGTVHTLEAVRHCDSVRAVVVVTSDKCYENREWVWGYRECDPMGGHDPYSSSKGCAELVTAAYRRSFFSVPGKSPSRVAVATARAGNVIGGGDWAADRLVPDLMRAFMAGAPVRLRYPDAIRPWQHVLDPLNGYLTLAERLYTDGDGVAEAWNFGPNDADARTVRWIADRLGSLWGGNPEIVCEAVEQVHEASHLKLDSSKSRARLGWQPRLSLEDALALTVQWFKAMQSKSDLRAVTESQIKLHMERSLS